MSSMGSSLSDQQQFFPVPAKQVWTALEQVLHSMSGLKVKHSDPMLMRAEFWSGVSLMSWGQNLVATIQPASDDGCYLSITGVGKFPTVGDRDRRRRIINDLIRRVSATLQG